MSEISSSVGIVMARVPSCGVRRQRMPRSTEISEALQGAGSDPAGNAVAKLGEVFGMAIAQTLRAPARAGPVPFGLLAGQEV